MSRRKGTPCACETDPCGCGSSKGKCVRAVNNVSPDPNGDFNIKAGTGIAISNGPDNEITIINSANPNAFVAGNNIELNPSGDDISIDLVDEPVIDGLTVNGTSTFNGDIIQNGAAYETHAEKIYTRDDYIIMRDGAIAALAPGDYSGFQVKLYDGVNDGRLVIDNAGTARVGDVGDEQPLLTRDENADLTDGGILRWDASTSKAKTSTGVTTVNNTVNDVTTGSPVNIANLTIPSTGTYLIITKIQLNYLRASSSVELASGIKINGTADYLETGRCSDNVFYPRLSASTVKTLNANDSLDLFIYISSTTSTYTIYGEITIIKL